MGCCNNNLVPFIRNQYRYGTTDANAAAFFTAAGITDATQKSAVNTLVVGLKAANLYTKFYAIYPFVGGSATTHKFNLINPADSDAAFRLSFSGGWTHSATGALPNGTNGYADTFFIPSAQSISLNSHSLHYYSRTNGTNISTSAGVNSGSLWDITLHLVGNFSTRSMTSGANVLNTSNGGDTLGLFLTTRTAANAQSNYKNGVLLGANALASTSKPTSSMVIGARNDGASRSNWDNRECAFFGIADGLTGAEVSTLYTLVQAMQTTLGRNV